MGTRVPAATCSWQGGFNFLVATSMPFLAVNSSFLLSLELPGTSLFFFHLVFAISSMRDKSLGWVFLLSLYHPAWAWLGQECNYQKPLLLSAHLSPAPLTSPPHFPCPSLLPFLPLLLPAAACSNFEVQEEISFYRLPF